MPQIATLVFSNRLRQDEKTDQSSACTDCDDEEARPNYKVAMTLEELFPGRFSIPLGCRFDAVPSQHSGDCAPGTLVPQVGQCTLQPAVTPIAILLCHADHQGWYIVLFHRPTWFAVRAAVVFLRYELSVPRQ